MQTFDEILSQVGQARHDVGDALQLAETRSAELDTLQSQSRERFETLRGAYSELNNLLATQSQRVMAVSGKLLQALGQGDTAMQGFVTAQQSGFTQLTARFSGVTQSHDATDAALSGHMSGLQQHDSQIEQLVAASRELGADINTQFHTQLDTFAETVSGLMTDTSQQVADHTQTLADDLSDVVETRLGAFADNLAATVKQAQSAISALQDHTGNSVDTELDHLRQQLQQLQDKLQHTVEQLSHAIDKLDQLVTKVAETLAHGGQAAAKVMKVTNVGLNEVFRFVENMNHLCDEVISAWE